MKRTMAMLLLLAVSACAESETVHLWNPKTDQIVKCPPVEDTAADPDRTPAPDLQCIEHYKQHGFIEMSAPR